MDVSAKHVFIVSAVLGIITAALLLRDRLGGKEMSDVIGPIRGQPTRFYPGQLPSPIGLTVEGAPMIPTITTPVHSLFARLRVRRMGFR